MQSPSPKKLGKRPELHEADGLDIQSRTTRLPQSPGTVRQKRVLPSRARRGGPGVGSCSVDMMIIDTERRTREGRPVIPPAQAFLLTTHSKAVPPPPESSMPDGEAAGSYFDKPEVKAAYLAQRAIQVPEFSPLPDDAVGGRLRARAEEEGPETSDLAYINRHRKYETFEKRQRRREKEKLVHEQYKLKERIEQLKGMDASAFGGGGEMRRKEMLDVAEGLEMRYAVLLPPDPKKMKKNGKRRRSEGARAGTTTGDDADADSEDEVAEQPHPLRDVTRPASTGPKPQQANRTRLALHPTTVSRSLAVSVAVAASEPNVMLHTYTPSTGTSAAPTTRTGQRVRDHTGRLLLRAKSEGDQTPRAEQFTPESTPSTPEAASMPPPRKRQRVDSQPKRQPSPDITGTTSVLLQIAARKAAQPLARQTSRTTLAFGYRVPQVVDAIHDDYAIPEWLITQSELERQHKLGPRSTTRSASPNPRVPNGVVKHATAVPRDAAADQEPNGAVMEVDDPHRPALPTSSIREENGKDDEMDSKQCN